jgi:hypothetical protein
MIFRVGGGLQSSTGIHSHVANEVWYLPLDDQRQQIGWVASRSADGVWTQYTNPNLSRQPTVDEIQGLGRKMDCIDCHNRSAHDVKSYAQEVDRALAEGRLDGSLPYLKKQALALGPQNTTQPSAEDTSAVLGRLSTLGDFYKGQYPTVFAEKLNSIEQATRALSDIYQGSVFPEMKVDSLTYADNIGHQDGRGCFRCHGTLVASNGVKAGRTLDNGCTLCHYDAGQ